MAYVNGIGLISPQKTAEGSGFLTDVVECNSDYLKCIEPNYRVFIDPMQSRRMSRMIKMGIGAARICLLDAGCRMPDAIITGTGQGSVEDTQNLLATIHLDQPFLNPTPFMQSTYNTISSQIAINLKCHGYNSTYVHRNFSFESGLQDALLQIDDGEANNILVGGIDEMTLNHLKIMRRLRELKMSPENNLELLSYKTKGALAGEGAGYFLLSSVPTNKTYCKLQISSTLYRPSSINEIQKWITGILESCKISIKEIDLIILGLNGDQDQDAIYGELSVSAFPGKARAYYKHLSGEYYTSTVFALWAASNIIRTGQCPRILKLDELLPLSFNHILIYNHFRGINHSLTIVSRLN